MLRPLFWDYNFDTLTWEEDRELIISRVLISGSWDAVTWLRSRAGDQYLREWIERLQGKGLSPLHSVSGTHLGPTSPTSQYLAFIR